MSIEVRPGPVAWVTIRRPEVRNALDTKHLRELRDAFRSLGGDAATRVIVLTGEGASFSSGADLGEVRDLTGDDEARAYFSGVAEVIGAEIACAKPVIARIRGYCLAGAMGLVGAADLAIADPAAVFGLPEVHVALFPMVVSSVLVRLMTFRRLQEMALTGRRVSAREALDAGLLTSVTDDLDGEVERVASDLARRPAQALRAGKEALWHLGGAPGEADFADLAGRVAALALGSEARHAIADFLSKRMDGKGERV